MNNQFWTVIICLITSALMIFMLKIGFKDLEGKDKALKVFVIVGIGVAWITIAYLLYLTEITNPTTATWL